MRSYEPVVVTPARQGPQRVVRRDAADEVVLALGANQEVRLRARDRGMRPSQVSIMPAGLDAVLTRGELADLVAFLKACK